MFKAVREPLTFFIPFIYVPQLIYRQKEMEKLMNNLVSHEHGEECDIFTYQFENKAAKARLLVSINVAHVVPTWVYRNHSGCQLIMTIEII
jgi:hypothetical protein